VYFTIMDGSSERDNRFLVQGILDFYGTFHCIGWITKNTEGFITGYMYGPAIETGNICAVYMLMLRTYLGEFIFILSGHPGKTDNIGHHDSNCLFHKSYKLRHNINQWNSLGMDGTAKTLILLRVEIESQIQEIVPSIAVHIFTY